MTIEIVPATLRDLTWIAAHMRPEDWAEIVPVCPEGIEPWEIAGRALASPEAWVARWKGQPVAALGVQSLTATVFNAWAFGTKAMWRAVPALTRFVLEERVPDWLRLGITRVEARSIAGNDRAHHWMIRMGAHPTPCRSFGRNGEDYVMFAWLAEDFR